jgi:5'-nucleotidase
LVFWGYITLNILVSNDDGVYAEGLWVLAEQLKELGKVTVVAPDRDQSGVGTSVTLRHPLRISKIRCPVPGVDAYSVEGTPADSVILALRFAMKEGADLIVSGINEGPNLGDDVFISGTVGAALQGYFYGIPAFAISVGGFENLDFGIAARLAKLLAHAVKAKNQSRRLLLNVNVPNVSQGKIVGLDVTRLARRDYMDKIEPGHDGKRNYYWITRGKSEWYLESGTDAWALKQNRISITSLPNDSDGASFHFIKEQAPGLFRKLLDGRLPK